MHHALENALLVEEIGEDPTRWLILGPDHAGNLLDLVVLDRPQGPALRTRTDEASREAGGSHVGPATVGVINGASVVASAVRSAQIANVRGRPEPFSRRDFVRQRTPANRPRSDS